MHQILRRGLPENGGWWPQYRDHIAAWESFDSREDDPWGTAYKVCGGSTDTNLSSLRVGEGGIIRSIVKREEIIQHLMNRFFSLTDRDRGEYNGEGHHLQISEAQVNVALGTLAERKVPGLYDIIVEMLRDLQTSVLGFLQVVQVVHRARAPSPGLEGS